MRQKLVTDRQSHKDQTVYPLSSSKREYKNNYSNLNSILDYIFNKKCSSYGYGLILYKYTK